MPGQNRDQRLTSVGRTLLLLALRLLLLGSIGWLVLGVLAAERAEPQAAPFRTDIPLLVALIVVAAASLAVGLVVRSRQRTLAALTAANQTLREEVDRSRPIGRSCWGLGPIRRTRRSSAA